MRKATKLTKRQLSKHLRQLPAWRVTRSDTQLERDIKLASYLDGLLCLARFAVYAEVHQHHPEVIWTYNRLRIKLTTHSEKGVTAKDIDFAQHVDRIVARSGILQP